MLKCWNVLQEEYDLSTSNKKAFAILEKSLMCLKQPVQLKNESDCISSAKCANGSRFLKLKVRCLYKLLVQSDCIVVHVNKVWKLNWEVKVWSKIFNICWSGLAEPKKKYFKWQLLLQKLPFDNKNALSCFWLS